MLLTFSKLYQKIRFVTKKHFCSNKSKNGKLQKKQKSFINPRCTRLSGPSRKHGDLVHPFFENCFILSFFPFFFFNQAKFVFLEQCLFIYIKVKYLHWQFVVTIKLRLETRRSMFLIVGVIVLLHSHVLPFFIMMFHQRKYVVVNHL